MNLVRALHQETAKLGTVNTRRYRPDIDGLRTIAIMSVMFFHAELKLCPGGFVGVDVFFVISGYLIGGHVLSEVDRREFTFSAFYVRRAKRILPALFGVLLVSYALAFALLTDAEIVRFGKSAIATVIAISNVYYFRYSGYFGPDADQNPLLMTWSLSVEEQFYVIFPVIAILLMNYMRSSAFLALALLSAISFALSIYGIRSNVSATFYLLPMRSWELGLGALLAAQEIEHGHTLGKKFAAEAASLVGLGLIAFATFRFGAGTPFPGETALAPVLGSALLITSERSWINRRLLSSRPFVGIGLISYSLYLWHWPILSFARVAADQPIGPVAALLLVALAFALAIASYYLIERPFRLGKALSARILQFYGLAILVVLAPPVYFASGRGGSFDENAELAHLERTVDSFLAEPCIVSYGVTSLDRSPACVSAEPRPGALALIGDSHAHSLASGLRSLAQREGRSFFAFTKSSCPPLAGVTRHMGSHPAHAQECSRFQRSVVAEVAGRAEITTVVLAGFWNAPARDRARGLVSRYVVESPGRDEEEVALLRRGLTEEIRQLRAAGKTVILLQDVPFLEFHPVRRFALDYLPLRRWLAKVVNPRPEEGIAPDPHRDLIAEIGAAEGVTVVDPFQTLCDTSRCRYREAGEILYVDPQHLSPAGAALIANLFETHR